MKSKWFTTVELEEIKNKHRNCDEQNGTAVVEEANGGNDHELQRSWTHRLRKKPSYRVNGVKTHLSKCLKTN